MQISRDCFANFVAVFRTTFVPVSHECRENFHVLRISRELVAKFFKHVKNSMRIFSPKYFVTLAQMSRDSLEQTSELSGEKIKLSDIRMNDVRHSHECLATVVRMK